MFVEICEGKTKQVVDIIYMGGPHPATHPAVAIGEVFTFHFVGSLNLKWAGCLSLSAKGSILVVGFLV